MIVLFILYFVGVFCYNNPIIIHVKSINLCYWQKKRALHECRSKVAVSDKKTKIFGSLTTLFRNMGINARIQLLTFGLVLISTLMIVGTVGYLTYRDTVALTQETLSRLTQQRLVALEEYLQALDNNIYLMAVSETARTSLGILDEAVQVFVDANDEQNPAVITETLQELYIDNNPNALGNLQNLDHAGDASSYSRVHSVYHPWFREFQQRNGYYDAFLVNVQGDVIYSVVKELDFGTNLLTGEFKDTGLGKIFREALALADASGSRIAYADWENYAPSHNAPASFLAHPVHYDEDDELLGVFIIQIPHSKMEHIMGDVSTLNKGEATFLINNQRDYLTRPRYAEGGKEVVLKEKLPENESLKHALLPTTTSAKDSVYNVIGHHGETVLQTFSSINFHGKKQIIVSEIKKSILLINASKIQLIILQIALVISVMMYFMVKMTSRTISHPIVSLTNAMNSLIDGNDSIDINGLKQKNEIGDMVNAVSVFKYQMVANKAYQLEKEKHDTVEITRSKRINALTEKFKDNVTELLKWVNNVTTNMQQSNQSVLKAVEESHKYSSEISKITQNASQDVQLVASVTSQMSISINEISDEMKSSLVTVEKASNAVHDTHEIVQNMSALSEKIGYIVSLINDIANQTNLLALNATIEAARAGESGKGFAVVASEVKTLANQTTKATDDIANQVSAIRAIASQSVTAMNVINDEINVINNSIGVISASTQQQSATTKEILHTSMNVASRTEEINQKVGIVSEHAENTVEQSQQMSGSVQHTLTAVSQLQDTIQEFLVQLSQSNE